MNTRIASSFSGISALAILAAIFGGCTKASFQAPIASSVHTEPSALKPALGPDGTHAVVPSVNVSITLSKSVLDQEFLYGADLQYSSYFTGGLDLYQQALSIGHIPVRFRMAGDELQLIADNKRLYASDVNHPEQLISRYKILAQSDSSLTISGANSGVFLSEVFEATKGDNPGVLFLASGAPPRDWWIRSFEFVPNGNLLLQQTSVVLSDGLQADFMESVMPRSSLAPGSSFQQIEMDPNNPAGGDSGIVSRFRLLNGETVHDGEKTYAMAQHFDLSPNSDGSPATIDWYVTPNVPDEYLPALKAGVEGWNRYFRSFKGISRDVVSFKGKLPSGIALGDPRYNIIDWDNRLIAGAAYESQASDPITGKQSHSLIYMPAAWLKIGMNYWQNGQFTEQGNAAPAHSVIQGHFAGRACFRDLSQHAALLASGVLSKDEVKTFGIELLKDVVFHEIGHSWGLAHNFKGSLSYDRNDPKSMFATSIMDYNEFNIERAAYDSVDSITGPLLEYDRQIMSAIYNKSQDIAASDAVLPTCNDNEADNESGGVDPLCIRYDIEKDPTLSVQTAISKIEEAHLPNSRDGGSLADAIRRVPQVVLTSDALSAVKSKDDLMSLVSDLNKAFKGAMNFYLYANYGSVARAVKTNIKSLLEFEDGILPSSFDAQKMRERAFAGVQKVISLTALPDAVLGALKDAQSSALAVLTQLDEGKKDADAIQAEFNDFVGNYQRDQSKGLPNVRVVVLSALARHDSVPYYFEKTAQSQSDYETAIVGILSDIALAVSSRSDAERIAAAKSLASYGNRFEDASVIQKTLLKLEDELNTALDNKSRELAQTLVTTLKPNPVQSEASK